METNLLPCPFCASSASVIRIDDDSWEIGCDQCCAVVWEAGVDAAIRAWNRRTSGPPAPTDMSVSAWLRRAALERVGANFQTAENQCSARFLALMQNRLEVGAYRYHDLHSPIAPRYLNITSARERLAAYLVSGNMEHLVDAANLAMVEFVRAPLGRGEHLKPTWEPADDGTHTPRAPNPKGSTEEVMDIHLTEQDCFRLRREAESIDLSDVEVCAEAVKTFKDRERPGFSLRGAAAALLDALFMSRKRARRLEKYILQKAKEHDFEDEASNVLFGDML